MALGDGDAFVSGSILSFQQANRIKDNWRAASAPSSPQAGSLFSDSDDEKLYHRQASAWMVIMQADNSLISTAAAGGYAFRIDAYQDDVTALTGLLRGAYIQASNGALVATGTIRGLELKARAGRPGETGNNVAVLEGLSISADAKTYDITTVMRGAEVILDGGAGSTVTKAVGIRIANNFQADIATLSYALEIYRDSFDYDADILLSSGGMIGGKAGDLRIDEDGKVYIYDEDGGDRVSIYHDKSDAYFKTTDGNFIFMTDEATNTASILNVKGKGTGCGYIRLFDEDNTEYLELFGYGGRGIIKTAGSSPGVIDFQNTIAQDIRFWVSIPSGNPSFYRYGYHAAVGVKYLRDYIHTDGEPYIRWNEGALNFQTDQATNTNTEIHVHGKGTGYGYLKIFDEDDAEWMDLYCSGGYSIIKSRGPAVQGLKLQGNIATSIFLWSELTAGNPYLYIYGYKTADAIKYGRHWVNPSGFYKIDAQLRGYLQQSGTDMAFWTDGKFNLLDDKIIAFGTGVDMCMGYMNTGDIWHLCDQATLGADIRMSINATGLSFFGVAPVAQAAHIADTGGDDAAVVNAILVVLENLGLVASA